MDRGSSASRVAIASFVERHEAELARRPPIARVPRGALVPASFAQQRIWFAERFGAPPGLYGIPLAWRLFGALDVGALEAALSEILRRHDGLRVVFVERDGAPWQVARPPSPVHLDVEDVGDDASAHVARALRDLAARTVDLSRDPLVTFSLLRVAAEEHVLLAWFHHIVADGGSVRVFRRELSALYAAFRSGAPSPLPELGASYLDFAAWQRAHLGDAALAPELAYWEEVLRALPEETDVAADRPRPARQSFRGRTIYFSIDAALTRRIRALARAHDATFFMVLLAAWATLLSRRSGQPDLAIGAPIAARLVDEVEPLIGCFINSLVLRVRPDPELTFHALLDAVRATSLGAYAHQEVPFERLVERLRPERSTAHTPLFQTMLNRVVPRVELELPGLRVERIEVASDTAKYDLTLMLQEVGPAFEANLEYSTDLFEPETAERLVRELVVLLEGAVTTPEARLWELPVLAPEERALLASVNRTRAPYAEDATLDGLVRAQAARTPERVAASCAGETVTYRDLVARAAGVAAAIVARGVPEGAHVGLFFERGLDALVAMLGALDAGCTYVPLDPDLPSARLERMSSTLALTATTRALAGRLPGAWPVLIVDGLPAVDGAPARASSPDAIAYVLHTSGSTGRPKGVAITHRSVVSFLESMRSVTGLGAHDVLLAVTTLSFDIAALELLLPLVVGARIELAPRDVVVDGRRIAALLARSGATYMQATPTTWRIVLAAGSGAVLDRLTVLVGGEALPPELARALLGRAKRVLNLYGPTETTIWSTAAELDVRGLDRGVPIGRPIANTDVFVLGPRLELVPVGCPGELYIGGVGLAREYVGLPEETARVFVPRPPACQHADACSDRLYRTGDRVRLAPSGALEYLGRVDHQVKLRGARIELGEIEAILGEHASVERCITVLRTDGPLGPRLVAFVVPRSPRGIEPEVLRAHVRAHLPPVMVPTSFVALPALPTTPNGKVDRGALAKVAVPDQGLVRDVSGEPPRDAIERELVRLFREQLGVARVGRDDSFFELGGHSFAVVALLARVHALFGRAVPVMTFFQAPTVAALAAVLRDGAARAEVRALEEIKPAGSDVPLFFIGSTLYARRLAPLLGASRPVYGLNIFGLQRDDGPLIDVAVPEVARRYVDELRAVSPEGPYLLAAYCADAKLAFEIALALRRAGASVPLVAFIDTVWIGENAERLTWRDKLHNLAHFRRDYVAAKLRRRVKRAGEQLDGLRVHAEVALHRVRGGRLPVRVLHQLLVRRYLAALAAYEASPYDGRIVLLASRELRGHTPEVLRASARGGLEVHELPGLHDELFDSPNLELLAERLRALLDAASAARP